MSVPPSAIDLRLQRSINWDKAKNRCEAYRRKLDDLDPFQSVLTSHCFLADATRSSFGLDGMEISANDAIVALDSLSAHKTIRSRMMQRIRNHVAALRTVDARVHHKQQLTTANFMRWYISFGCGLCPSTPDPSGIARIEHQIQQIISPELRFKAAIQQIVKLQITRTVDPLVPSFNGILSRLLLRYHIGRCGLPPIVFPEGTTEKMLTSERKLTNLILECVDSSYAMLIVSNAKH